jgi:hypothetical protein
MDSQRGLLACPDFVPYIPMHVKQHMMMHRQILFLVLVIAAISPAPAQSDAPQQTSWTFLPDGIQVPPFAANYQEPRVGVRKQLASSRLKLDIGSVLDVVEYSISPEKRKSIRAGIDFFTYALSTSANGLRLQIDAVDGYFGGHISYKSIADRSSFSLRLRLIHLSAHFIDGHFDNSTGTWKNGIPPLPFTKDFGELTASCEFPLSEIAFRAYSGFSYATLIRPTEINRISSLHGFEAYTTNLPGEALGRPFHFFLADNLTITGIPWLVGTNNVEAGVKFGEWSGTGMKIYASYYSGLTIFSQYYNVRDNQWGIGFTFDVW